ncbi:MAG: hypothetical protein IJP14_04535 [Clostridia bacterium]|nr:hypothetical protein [Clostridia bacterium]
MKKVFLIGDSIRFGSGDNSPGYGVYVKQGLAGKAEVLAPNDNCRFAQYTLRYLRDWTNCLSAEHVDIVHWNNGLWDVLRINGDEPLTPCDVYVEFLRRIHANLRKLFPNAKIIFALSTPVVEEWANPDFYRLNADIERYNAAATELMQSLGVEVNDLYTVAKGLDESYRDDWVHYNAAGCEVLGKAVLNVIGKALS